VAAGERPVLAGRSAESVGRLAAELGLDQRVFALDEPAAVDRGLAGMKAVLHCAGPFSRTAAPMADACLRAHVHYLDITGEIEVFEGMAARHSAAQHAGVTLLPGVGFDVVPSDCLAAHLHGRRPVGVNERFRCYRYEPGQRFAPHYDGAYQRSATVRRDAASRASPRPGRRA
jgi:saccharopine dehydrogenase (NAD+, L-lysine-forming)